MTELDVSSRPSTPTSTYQRIVGWAVCCRLTSATHTLKVAATRCAPGPATMSSRCARRTLRPRLLPEPVAAAGIEARRDGRYFTTSTGSATATRASKATSAAAPSEEAGLATSVKMNIVVAHRDLRCASGAKSCRNPPA